MITIIRYRDDTYYGLEGVVKKPTRSYSGYTNEDIVLEKLYVKKMEDFEEKRKNATFLNKVHAKNALDKEIPDWKEKFRSELRDITYKLKNINDNFSDQLYKKHYTLYHLKGASLEEMTKPTEETN